MERPPVRRCLSRPKGRLSDLEKKALLILVHGTPRPAANRDLYAVIERLKQRPDAAQKFPIVEIGFMECNEPTIPEAIALCIAAGAQSVVAVPYFLHTGTHVADDLPSLLEQATA